MCFFDLRFQFIAHHSLFYATYSLWCCIFSSSSATCNSVIVCINYREVNYCMQFVSRRVWDSKQYLSQTINLGIMNSFCRGNIKLRFQMSNIRNISLLLVMWCYCYISGSLCPQLQCRRSSAIISLHCPKLGCALSSIFTGSLKQMAFYSVLCYQRRHKNK
jgi:hypothetical protein